MNTFRLYDTVDRQFANNFLNDLVTKLMERVNTFMSKASQKHPDSVLLNSMLSDSSKRIEEKITDLEFLSNHMAIVKQHKEHEEFKSNYTRSHLFDAAREIINKQQNGLSHPRDWVSILNGLNAHTEIGSFSVIETLLEKYTKHKEEAEKAKEHEKTQLKEIERLKASLERSNQLVKELTEKCKKHEEKARTPKTKPAFMFKFGSNTWFDSSNQFNKQPPLPVETTTAALLPPILPKVTVSAKSLVQENYLKRKLDLPIPPPKKQKVILIEDDESLPEHIDLDISQFHSIEKKEWSNALELIKWVSNRRFDHEVDCIALGHRIRMKECTIRKYTDYDQLSFSIDSGKYETKALSSVLDDIKGSRVRMYSKRVLLPIRKQELKQTSHTYIENIYTEEVREGRMLPPVHAFPCPNNYPEERYEEEERVIKDFVSTRFLPGCIFAPH